MGITAKQREQRRGWIGSSDMAAILGTNPYRNAHDIWLDKTGRVDDEPENAAMEAGTMFEDDVIAYARQLHGDEMLKGGLIGYAGKQLGALVKNQRRTCPKFHLASNIDIIVKKTGDPVECKTAGLFGPLSPDWGDDGTDHVPAHIIVQCHVHMICAKRKRCAVVAFLGGRGFAVYEIKMNAELAKMIKAKARWFWDHVTSDTAPENIIPSLPVIKRVRRVPKKSCTIHSSLIKIYNDAKREAAEADYRKKRAQAAILEAMGDAEGATAGPHSVTYFEQDNRRPDTTKLRREFPKAAETCIVNKPNRVMRIRG